MGKDSSKNKIVLFIAAFLFLYVSSLHLVLKVFVCIFSFSFVSDFIVKLLMKYWLFGLMVPFNAFFILLVLLGLMPPSPSPGSHC